MVPNLPRANKELARCRDGNSPTPNGTALSETASLIKIRRAVLAKLPFHQCCCAARRAPRRASP
eukprot:9673861-Lingulodinium_polyedra.AAC.1